MLHFAGADILDGTPLLDIKPFTVKFDGITPTRNGWQDEVDDETVNPWQARFPGKEAGVIVAIASGRAAGKTSLAVNLAHAGKNAPVPVQLLDCRRRGAERHLFRRHAARRGTINIAVPDFDPDKCDACDKCVEFCQFNALASVGKTPLLFPSCATAAAAACWSARRTRSARRTTGSAWSRLPAPGHHAQERLPRCRRLAGFDAGACLKERLEDGITTILDAPPGTACQAVATLRGSDFVVLVTEPRRSACMT